jgi:uncharacterized membrane protein YgcG
LGKFIVGESGKAVGQATDLTLAEMDARSKEITQKAIGIAEGVQGFVIPELNTITKGSADMGQALLQMGDAGAEGLTTLRDNLSTNVDALKAYITQAAIARNIDPAVALKVAAAETANFTKFIGDANSSFGPFQLHIGGLVSGPDSVAGLGDAFQKLTGEKASNPATWADQIDFALDNAAKNGWAAWHAAAAVGISDWQGIGKAVDTATPELGAFNVAVDSLGNPIQTAAGDLGDLSQAAVDSASMAAASMAGMTVDAMTFANQFGISIDAANKILLDHGSVAKIVLNDNIPGDFNSLDTAVERFADAFQITWDQARAILTSSGAVSDAVMGVQMPKANQATQDAVKATGQAHSDLKPKVTDVKDAMSSLAKDGFDVANKSQGQLATDMATQVSFVLQQLDEKMPDLIQNIKDFITQLNNIPRDIEVNIHTNGAVEASASAGGSGDNSGGDSGGGDSGGGSSSGDSGTFGYSPSNPSPHPGESGPGGIYNDPHTGQPYPFAAGGVLTEPVFGVGRSGRTYTFAESGPEWFGGVGKAPIDYDLLATKIAMAITQVNLSVSVDDIHTGLLKKQRRNGNLGWVTQ